MKGDFSRRTFDKDKHFSRVLMQQGRVQLDADWNEQTSILLHYLRTMAADLIGTHGGPDTDLGFEITLNGGDIKIGRGRYYVGGILCENVHDEIVPVPDVEDPGELDLRLLYLDVWERHISYLEDEDEHGDNPSIREVALGGADSATRAKVVWQVQALPVAELPLATKVKALLETLESATFPLADATVISVNRTVVQLRDLGPAITAMINSLPDDVTEVLKAIVQSLQDLIELSSGTEEEVNDLKEQLTALRDHLSTAWRLLTESKDTRLSVKGLLTKSADTLLRRHLAPSQARLRARARQDPEVSDDPCAIPPESRYRGLENQLYRVEVHQGGGTWDGEDNTRAGAATIKWSRENGSVVFPIVEIADEIVTLEHLGKDDRLSLQVGDWVEIVDDDYILGGDCAPLLKVEKVDPDRNQVTLSGEPTIDVEQDPFNHPLLRRWDHKEGTLAKKGFKMYDGSVLIKEGKDWLPLEDGVEIQFVKPDEGEPPNYYRTGDYWLIPARTATGDVEWPGTWKNPAAVPPHGVEHHIAPLAIIDLDANTVTDCRRSFAPRAISI